MLAIHENVLHLIVIFSPAIAVSLIRYLVHLLEKFEVFFIAG